MGVPRRGSKCLPRQAHPVQLPAAPRDRPVQLPASSAVIFSEAAFASFRGSPP